MREMDQEFVLADLKRTIAAREASQPMPAAVAESGQDWLAQVSQMMLGAEQESISRESITALNPHLNMAKGDALKRFIKRVIRKMIMWFIQPIVIQQTGYNCLNNNITNRMRDSLSLMKDELVRQRDAADAQARAMPEQFRHLETLAGRCDAQAGQLEQLSAGMQELRKQLEALGKPEEQITDYIDYAAFEEVFRGSQAEIRSRIRRYLDYFRPGSKVLDLGCGRGEWLELLNSIGAEPTGVDLNPTTVAECRKKNLHVTEGNLFDYLEELPDCSLDGITAIQVVEHLTPVQLARLTQLCYNKLAFGGRVIFETQNPAVVSTMTQFFYVDPTHIRPVHPVWAKYVLECSGFSEVALEYPQYAWITDGSIPPLELPGGDAALFNDKITYLNNLLYGSTDYAVTGVKR